MNILFALGITPSLLRLSHMCENMIKGGDLDPLSLSSLLSHPTTYDIL